MGVHISVTTQYQRVCVPLLTLNLTTIKSMQIQNKHASTPHHVVSTMQPPIKITVCKMYSYQHVKIIKQKEWHWPVLIPLHAVAKCGIASGRPALWEDSLPHCTGLSYRPTMQKTSQILAPSKYWHPPKIH
jgi:hypothetical protein